jgi:hypothetical protein
MLIISTRPVAEIIHAVSAASILAGADGWASAEVAMSIIAATAPANALKRAAINLVMLSSPRIRFFQSASLSVSPVRIRMALFMS